MKPKTVAFADKILENPKTSNTQAYIDTHTTENRHVARVESTKLMAKPSVKIYLQKHANRAKNRVIELVQSDKQDIALKASIEILDRTYGKSIARTETNNTNLNLNIDASKELGDKFTEFITKQTQAN